MAKVFVQGKKSMKFFMVECPERKKIASLIEKNGGKISALRDSECIELVPYEVSFTLTNKVSHPVYSYNYVKDSVLLKEVQDLKDYRMSILTSVKKPTRNSYKAEDDEKMKKYVETHSGNPAVVKFWDDALNKGLEVNHTADSLRHHWIKVLPNKTFPIKTVGLPSKRQSEVYQPDQSPTKKLKEEIIVVPDEEELKSIRVVVKNSRREIYDFGEINNRCEDEEIDAKFDKLVEICSALSGKRVSKQEVLRSLVARKGDVQATIGHFEEKH